MTIIKDVYKLRQPLQSKVLALLDDAKTELPNLVVFETLRSEYRQAQLFGLGRNSWQMAWAYPTKREYWAYSQPQETKRTWTTKSKHLTGEACDFAFRTKEGHITWEGDWDKFLELVKRHGLKPLLPNDKGHLEYSKSYSLTLQYMEEAEQIAKQLWVAGDEAKKAITSVLDTFTERMVEIQEKAHLLAEEARK